MLTRRFVVAIVSSCPPARCALHELAEVERRHEVAVEHQERVVEIRERGEAIRPCRAARPLGRRSARRCARCPSPKTASITCARWPTDSVMSTNPCRASWSDDDLEDRAVAERHQRLRENRRVRLEPRSLASGEDHDLRPPHLARRGPRVSAEDRPHLDGSRRLTSPPRRPCCGASGRRRTESSPLSRSTATSSRRAIAPKVQIKMRAS